MGLSFGNPHVTSNLTAQPNLDFSQNQSTWSFRFWTMTALTGAVTGLIGGALMRLLGTIEHTAWRYDTGTFLEAIGRASASRHILTLLAAGVIVGVAGRFISQVIGSPGDAESAIWFRSGKLPLLSTFAQAINSIVTVGMGSSLGRESPIKQAGGAIASRISQWSGLSRSEQRVLVASGVGAGMAAAYNVPVGGALFAVEVLLGSISLRLALPALLCSGMATAASWVLLPTGPVYHVPEYPLSIPLIVWSLAAGPLLGLATVPMVRAYGWAGAHKPHGGASVFVVPMVIFTLLGAISIAFPPLLGNGMDAVQLAFGDKIGISMLLVLPALKLLATAGCVAAGAPGGLFTPTMTIGALLGGLFGHAWNYIWPGASLGSCSVIGACAFMAGSSQGPISALVLVLELTRHVDATMVPMLLAVTGAMLVARRIESRSIYSIRLHSAEPPAKVNATAFNGMISNNFASISAATGYAAVVRHLWLSHLKPPVYVLDHQGKLLGTIDMQLLETGTLGPIPIEAAKAADLVAPVRPLDTRMTEQDVTERLAAADDCELPVIDAATGRMIGVIANRKPIDDLRSVKFSGWKPIGLDRDR